MSDLHALGQKLEEGADWRGSITVSVGGEEMELTVRQLRDPEFEEVMGMVDTDAIDAYQSELPSELAEERQELQEKDDLSEDDSERLAEVTEEIKEQSPNPFSVLPTETFEGIRKAAKYGVVPDREDKERAFREDASTIEDEYGYKVQTPDDTEEYLNDKLEEWIDNSTDFVSINLGIRVLTATLDEEGN